MKQVSDKTTNIIMVMDQIFDNPSALCIGFVGGGGGGGGLIHPIGSLGREYDFLSPFFFFFFFSIRFTLFMVFQI